MRAAARLVSIRSRWSLNITKNFAIFWVIDVDIANVYSDTAKCGCSSRILLVGWHGNGSWAAQDAIGCHRLFVFFAPPRLCVRLFAKCELFRVISPVDPRLLRRGYTGIVVASFSFDGKCVRLRQLLPYETAIVVKKPLLPYETANGKAGSHSYRFRHLAVSFKMPNA
jgi:hypothetical protein